MRKKYVFAAAAASAALFLTGCSSDEPANSAAASPTGGATGGDDPVVIGMITKFPVDFYDIMVDSAKAWDEAEPGATVIFAQGESGTDDEGEIAAIQSMVTQGVDAIAITPTSPAVQGELQKAVDAGIKVILIDNDIPDWDGKTAVVATNNLAGGELAGKWFADNVPAGAKVGILQGVLGNPSLDDRVTGFKNAAGDHITVVAETATDCDQTKGLNAGQDMITANPDLDAIYSACGPPITGALEAVKSAGLTDLITVGFDASPDEIAAIAAGTQTGSVAQFPDKMGSMGVQAAFDAVMGKPVEANIDTGTDMVTKANVADFQ